MDYNFDGIYLSYVEKKTCGMTSVCSDKVMNYYISKRGKNIGGINLDQLYGCDQNGTYAVCLVGSSSLGLEGVCGFNRQLSKNGEVSRALGACIYSWNLVEGNLEHPDVELGLKAYDLLQNKKFKIGQWGAGLGARVGKLYENWKEEAVYGGQGGAFFEEGKFRFLVINVINSIGIVHENSLLLHQFKVKHNKIKTLQELPDINSSHLKPLNTTLTICVTNIKMNESEQKNLSEILHDVVQSMIYPYGTIYDGDVLFLLTTNDYSCKINDKCINQMKNTIKNAIRSVFICSM